MAKICIFSLTIFRDNHGDNQKAKKEKTASLRRLSKRSWAHLGSNQGPSDYESDALTG